MTDNELIRGIRENSAAAWRELYWANYSKIRAIVEPMLRFTRDKTFDDVYTEALMALMENVKDGKLTESDSTNLSGYIYTLCRRTVRRLEDRGRTAEEKMKQMKEEVEAEAKESGGEPFAQDDEDDGIVSPEEYEAAMAFLERVLESIPPSCKAILRRFYWDRLPMRDIAALMGLKNEDSAKTTKNKCMNKFKKIAKAMLSDDAKTEDAVRRTVERNSLRALLEEFRLEGEGELSIAAMKEKKKKGWKKQ